MNSSGNPPKAGDQPGGKPAATVNERTYQEVEYLKKNLGPILVAALAEICIRRPADPIEYLGHWLLRWRYNEELKRRDVQNALDVVRQRQWAQAQEETAVIQQEKFAAGFIPTQAHGPPGYGGPLTSEELGENQQQEVQEVEFHPPEEVTGGEGAEIFGEGGPAQYGAPFQEDRRSFGKVNGEEERRSSYGQEQRAEERKSSFGKEQAFVDNVPSIPHPGDGTRGHQSQAQHVFENDRRTSIERKNAAESEKKASIPRADKQASLESAQTVLSDRRASNETAAQGQNAGAEHVAAEGAAPPAEASEQRKKSDASEQRKKSDPAPLPAE